MRARFFETQCSVILTDNINNNNTEISTQWYCHITALESD